MISTSMLCAGSQRTTVKCNVVFFAYVPSNSQAVPSNSQAVNMYAVGALQVPSRPKQFPSREYVCGSVALQVRCRCAAGPKPSQAVPPSRPKQFPSRESRESVALQVRCKSLQVIVLPSRESVALTGPASHRTYRTGFSQDIQDRLLTGHTGPASPTASPTPRSRKAAGRHRGLARGAPQAMQQVRLLMRAHCALTFDFFFDFF